MGEFPPPKAEKGSRQDDTPRQMVTAMGSRSYQRLTAHSTSTITSGH
jgi:hypothetical protein